MRESSTLSASLLLSALALCVAASGCAGSNADSVLDLDKIGLGGTWSYMPTNAHDATFTGCTGQAQALEGMTFADVTSEAPNCYPSFVFDVIQIEEGFTVVPHEVDCSDGSTAILVGAGIFDGSSLSGEWESQNDEGVVAFQSFSGSGSGNTIAIQETSRTFSGAYAGSCELSPPLSVTITVD